MSNPAPAPVFAFKAGQALDMTPLDPPETDAEGNTRAFSIAIAPHEDTLMVATRMRGTAFERLLFRATDFTLPASAASKQCPSPLHLQ